MKTLGTGMLLGHNSQTQDQEKAPDFQHWKPKNNLLLLSAIH